MPIGLNYVAVVEMAKIYEIELTRETMEGIRQMEKRQLERLNK